jgi:hypothetical protein
MNIKNEIYALKKGLGNYLRLRKDTDFLDWQLNYAPQLEQFRDIHKGEDCFIMGNGPSLNNIDLSLLNDYYVFGTNKIYLIFDKVKLNLSYHLSMNPLMIEQSKKEIEQGFNCPSFLSYRYSKGVIKDEEHIFRLYDKAAWIFTGNITRPIAEGFTITSVALQLAYFMGFQRVFLIGVDHNFQQKGKPNTVEVSEVKDVNHFSPNYVGGQQWYLADIEASEISYMQAKYFYANNDRKLFDATYNGKLTIFEKITYEEALLICKKKM